MNTFPSDTLGMMAHTFDISPEKRASRINFIWRQLFVTPPPVSSDEINLAGRTALVTGATGGIGLEITRQLLGLGCKILMGVRDERKGESVRQDLIKGGNLDDDMVQVWKLDLSSYQSIIAFAANAKSLENLNIAILNAGIYKVSEAFSSTGYEEGMQINYLSNILLLISLLPIIKKNAPAGETGHICLVSSDTAAWAKYEERTSTPLLPALKIPMKTWDMGERYGTTKLLGHLFLTALSKRGSSVTLSCANPGLYGGGSDLAREAKGILRFAHKMQCLVLSRTCAVGARTIVHSVTTLHRQAHGHYVEGDKIQPMAPIVYQDEGKEVAERLYEETLHELSFAGYGLYMATMALPTTPLFEFHYERDGRLVVRETHYAENKLVRDEYFQVESGTLAVIKNGKKGVLTKDGGIIKIPPGTRFWAEAPVTANLVFRVWAEPQNLDRGFDEAFLRNYLGYLRDCEDQNIQPSVFQLALLGWNGDTLLSPPCGEAFPRIPSKL
ncbi:short-chain dehydrogenase reductase family [Fusarium circinatum]|uniref:Short-chain dehydrogenase reductase family n=1 Tax=Fusarium circinatum TaxID=48490 RepID=A0A8H5SU81_FUSCI|nr:short-chain dehydrogenase reductase family [Fusarium circinatum]